MALKDIDDECITKDSVVTLFECHEAEQVFLIWCGVNRYEFLDDIAYIWSINAICCIVALQKVVWRASEKSPKALL